MTRHESIAEISRRDQGETAGQTQGEGASSMLLLWPIQMQVKPTLNIPLVAEGGNRDAYQNHWDEKTA